MPTLENQPGDAPGFSSGEPVGDGAGGAPYQPPRLLTGHPTLDAMLDVWHGACSPSGPPRWEDLADLIWHPWSMSLILVESRHRMKPARSAEAFPVATTLLGLPLFFRGALPMDNCQAAELSEMTRVVSMRQRMVRRILPARTRPDGSICQPWVAGVPLLPVPASFWGRPVERVLFSVAAPVRAGAVKAAE
jgi:hypothetical protein